MNPVNVTNLTVDDLVLELGKQYVQILSLQRQVIQLSEQLSKYEVKPAVTQDAL